MMKSKTAWERDGWQQMLFKSDRLSPNYMDALMSSHPVFRMARWWTRKLIQNPLASTYYCNPHHEFQSFFVHPASHLCTRLPLPRVLESGRQAAR